VSARFHCAHLHKLGLVAEKIAVEKDEEQFHCDKPGDAGQPEQYGILLMILEYR
jgi:hypothetical protein